MKKLLVATVLSLCVSSAFAAETAVLKVTGTLTNSACTPELSNGGVVDYGIIRLGELSSTSNNQLGQKEIGLTINCTAATKVGWSVSDDRADSSAGITISGGTASGNDASESYFHYGVGKTNNGISIGNYSIFVRDNKVTIDSTQGDITGRNKDWAEGTWAPAPSAIRSDSFQIVSAANAGTSEPVAFKTAVFPLVTTLAIKDTNSLAITDDTSLDGQATITLTYL
ncbi:DUF1120 domain-containing protein [Enterobacter mori]